LERGIVNSREALLPRAIEIHPLFSDLFALENRCHFHFTLNVASSWLLNTPTNQNPFTQPNQTNHCSHLTAGSVAAGAVRGGAWVERWMVVKAFLADGDGDGGGCAGRSTRAFVSSNHHLLLEYK